MTCVVGLVDGSRVLIGADSAGLSGWHLTVRSDPKVFESHGFLYGFSGSFRLGQVLRYQFKPPHYEGGDVMAFMVGSFIPALRTAIDHEVSGKAKTEAPGDFLVGFRGRLFEVCTDFQVGENACGFGAVGCGREPALGALHVLDRLHKDMPARGKLTLALKTAEAWSGGVRGPFTVLVLGMPS